LPKVFGRHVVLFDLFGVNFRHVRIRCILHTTDRVGLEGLALFSKFFDTLRARFRDVRQPLIVPRLASGTRPHAALFGQNGAVRASSWIVLFLHALPVARGLPCYPNQTPYAEHACANGAVVWMQSVTRQLLKSIAVG
jgi:hypothetical protein